MHDAGGMQLADVAPELTVLVGAILALLFALAAPRRLQRTAAYIALATCALAGAELFALAGGPHLSFAGTYALDAAARVASLIVLVVTVAVIALSVRWFETDPRQGEYYTLLLMSALGAIVMARATDLMGMVIGVLLSSATGYVLSAYHRQSRRSAEAAIKYFLIGALTNAALVFGVVLLFGVTSTTTLGEMRARLAGGDPTATIAGVTLIVVGLAFKMGAVPAHAWMPDVADGAPAPVAAFVTIAPKVGALVALARIAAVLPESVGWRPVLAVLAALTMILGNASALWQDDVRRLLGWSAISQTGYALMGIVALGRSALAIPGLVYFLGAYALGGLTAFGTVVALGGRADRAAYAGLARTNPWLALALVIAFLSFVGIPPTAGFAGKLVLFGAAIEAGYAWLAFVAAVNSVISLAYYARVLAPAYFGESTGGAGDIPGWPAAAVAATGAAVIVAGIAADVALAAMRSRVFLPG